MQAKNITRSSILPVLRQPTASGSRSGSTWTAQRFPRRRVFPTFCALPSRSGLENMHPEYVIWTWGCTKTLLSRNRAALRTCLSTDGLLSFLTERFPSTLKFALPWDDFKTAPWQGNRTIHEKDSIKTCEHVNCKKGFKLPDTPCFSFSRNSWVLCAKVGDSLSRVITLESLSVSWILLAFLWIALTFCVN